MPDFIGGLAKGIENSRGMIQKAMEGVSSDMTISPTAALQEISVSGSDSGSAAVSEGVNIEIKEMSVRSDDDIRKISQQLYRQLQQGRRANGYA